MRRQRPPKTPTGLGFRGALTADPLVSVNRILGLGDGGLPFYDDLLGRLSEVDFALVFGEAGLGPETAIARAKQVVEASTPEAIFTPIWRALGQHGPLELEALRRLDWTPLRKSGDDGRPPLDPGPPPPLTKRKTGLQVVPPPAEPKKAKAKGKSQKKPSAPKKAAPAKAVKKKAKKKR
ncbi:MAG: hypothetical protein U1E65_25565 [Myxococcota bacterium]